MKEYWKNTQDSILEHVGSMQQLAPVRRVAFLEGRSKSVEAIEVDTGAGLSFTVLVDRALDLAMPAGAGARSVGSRQRGLWRRPITNVRGPGGFAASAGAC